MNHKKIVVGLILGLSLGSSSAWSQKGGSDGNPYAWAQSLDKKKNYLIAMKVRSDTLVSGAYSQAELSKVGDTALAFNRLSSVGRLAGILRNKVSTGQMPVSFRAAVANALFKSGKVSEAGSWMPPLSALGQIAAGPARYRAHVVASGILAAQGQLAKAIDALAPVMEGSDKQDLGFLRVQRARLFYELRRYPEALEELVRVPKSSPSWFSGMRVAVWASYQIRDYNLALGQLKSIHNPFLFGKFSPETHSVEAITLYQLCYFDAALQSVKRMREKYQKLLPSLQRFRRSYGQSSQGVDAILSYVRGQKGAPDVYPNNHWALIMDGILSAEVISDYDATIAQVEKEEKVVRGDDKLRRFQSDLNEARQEAKNRIAPLMRSQLASMEKELAETLESSLAIEVEINTQIRERLLSGKPARRREVDFETEIKKGYEFWPFEGEYWRDEIGGYAFVTTDVCGELKL